MLDLNKEIVEKLKQAKTPEGLIILAKENNLDLSEEQAKEYFTKLNFANGELSDEDLKRVIGGFSFSTAPSFGCANCGALYGFTFKDKANRKIVICNSCGYEGEKKSIY